MTELVITRGYPASGKSTWAKEKASQPGWARVCRDDLRGMLFDGEGVLDHGLEAKVSIAEDAQVAALLKSGLSVVVDATHLRLKFARAWADLAVKLGVDFQVKDFAAISVDECVERDAQRGAAGGRTVGETDIRDMAVKFPYARWEPVAPRLRADGEQAAFYTPDLSLPPAYLVDIDGTLAKMVDRSPFDWDRVDTDLPVQAVVELVRHLAATSNRVVVMSGRDEQCRSITESWLKEHDIPFDQLYMRPIRDTHKDSVVKAELFDKHVRHSYNVRGVIDDRLQVCRMWHSIGLPLFRVGDPDADF